MQDKIESLGSKLSRLDRSSCASVSCRSLLRNVPFLVKIPKNWTYRGELRSRSTHLSSIFYKLIRLYCKIFKIDNFGGNFGSIDYLNYFSTHESTDYLKTSGVDELSELFNIINYDFFRTGYFRPESYRIISKSINLIPKAKSPSIIDMEMCRRFGGIALQDYPLWVDAVSFPKMSTPDELLNLWHQFRDELLAENMDFDVWITWYEAILTGNPMDYQSNMIRAGIEVDWIKRGPSASNREIKRRLFDAGKWNGNYETSLEALIPPEPIPQYGTQLQPTPSGLDIVEREIPIGERIDPQIAALHQNILRRIGRLDGVIARLDNSHRLLSDEYRDFAAFVTNELPDISVATVWSVGCALTEIIDRYEAKRQSAILADRNIETLELPDEQIFGQLVQLSRDFSAFILAFEEGRTLLQRTREMRLDRTASQTQTSNILKPMLASSGLFAEQAKRLLIAVDRAIDIADERTTTLASASISLATNSVIAIGRVAHRSWKPVVAASVVIGAPIDIMHKLAGDPNWEVTRAAMQYLTQNANALYAFANHDPVMRRWLEWTIEQVNIAIEAEAKTSWPDGLELQKKLRDEWER